MTCTVEVIESFVLQNGTLKLGGDLEVGGNVRAAGFAMEGTPALGFETEIKMFLANECPAGWTEATELGGYMLMGRTPGGQVNATKNRPMGANEDGRMHSTYYKGDPTSYEYPTNQLYDDRYFGGYYSARGAGSTDADGGCSTSGACTFCSLPGSNARIDCQTNFGGKAQLNDYHHSSVTSRFARYDKLTNPAYQTSDYMAPIGEYYPFASVLLCKRL